MAILRVEPHGTDVAWAASGSINLELSPKPYTICGIVLSQLMDITTTSATWLEDAYERFISSLTLSGGGETYFDFTDMRIAYHAMRFHLGPVAPRRFAAVADSVTAGLRQCITVLHFGVQGVKYTGSGPKLNMGDLTAGIPPTGSGNLTLQGTFGAAAAMGSANVTINVSANCRLQVYTYGVQPTSGDLASAYMPRALPHWVTQSPTPTATSSPFATTYNVPAGDFLRDMTFLFYNGTNDPRESDVITSLKLVNNLSNRDVLRYGGFTDSIRHGKIAETFSQLWLGGAPPSDSNGVLVTPSVASTTGASDEGIVYLPIHEFAEFAGGGSPYGLDLRAATTGDLQVQTGVADSSNITYRVLLKKYKPL